jgi:hypothetical protein
MPASGKPSTRLTRAARWAPYAAPSPPTNSSHPAGKTPHNRVCMQHMLSGLPAPCNATHTLPPDSAACHAQGHITEADLASFAEAQGLPAAYVRPFMTAVLAQQHGEHSGLSDQEAAEAEVGARSQAAAINCAAHLPCRHVPLCCLSSVARCTCTSPSKAPGAFQLPPSCWRVQGSINSLARVCLPACCCS